MVNLSAVWSGLHLKQRWKHWFTAFPSHSVGMSSLELGILRATVLELFNYPLNNSITCMSRFVCITFLRHCLRGVNMTSVKLFNPSLKTRVGIATELQSL